MVRWYVVNLIVFAAIQTKSWASQQFCDSKSNFLIDVTQKLEEINETISQNAASLKRQLSEESDKHEEIELKNRKDLQQLSDTVQQLQTKLSKMEKTLDRNLLGVRLLLTSSTESSARNMGDMLLSAVKKGDASPPGTWCKRRIRR